MTAVLRLLLRAFLALATILLIICIMGVTWGLGARRATRAVMQAAFRINAPVWGIRVRTMGALSGKRPLIVVSNHFSYLDLFVLGSRIPAAFTPKSEVRSWPLIGFMCMVSGCLFIDRRAMRTLDNKRQLKHALAAGDIVSIFPEGTTSDGTGMLPFKSSFFSLAEETRTDIQPISVVYTHLNGRPVDAASLPVIGWYGDSTFFPHLAQYLQQQSVDATIIFHAPVNASHFASRKELAAYCKSVIERGVHEVLESQKNAPGTNPEA